MAALSTLAAQAKGFTATLPRPKFLAAAALPPDLTSVSQTQQRPTKSLSASSLSTCSTSEETADEVEERSSTSDSVRSSQRSRLGSEDLPAPAAVVLLPWELHDAAGDVVESVAVREKVLELAVYRRTFIEDATGEDEFTFQYAVRIR